MLVERVLKHSTVVLVALRFDPYNEMTNIAKQKSAACSHFIFNSSLSVSSMINDSLKGVSVIYLTQNMKKKWTRPCTETATSWHTV